MKVSASNLKSITPEEQQALCAAAALAVMELYPNAVAENLQHLLGSKKADAVRDRLHAITPTVPEKKKLFR